MNVANRRRLLALAKWMDLKATAIRAYCKRVTPKKPRKVV